MPSAAPAFRDQMLLIALDRLGSASSRRNSRACAVAPEDAAIERLQEGHVGIAVDQHVLADMRGDGDAAQLLHVPAAQRLRPQAQPDAAPEQAERIVDQACSQDGSRSRSSTTVRDLRFQLAEQRNIAALDQDVVMRRCR